jgi:hypothetical protein
MQLHGRGVWLGIPQGHFHVQKHMLVCSHEVPTFVVKSELKLEHIKF